MADSEDYQLPCFLPMDLDIPWSADDMFDDIPHLSMTAPDIPAKMSNLAVEFQELQSRSKSTSTPFGQRKIPWTASTAPLYSKEYVENCNDSGFEVDSNITACFAGQCTLSCSTSKTCHNHLTIDSDELQPCFSSSGPKSDVDTEQQYETDSAFGECSSICSLQSQGLSDYHSGSADLPLANNVFRALDPNLSECSLDLSPFIDVPCPSPISRNSGTNSPALTCDSSQLGSDVQSYIDSIPELSKSVLDRLIGRKMGLDEVDIVAELSQRNMSTCVELIFSFVEPQDICRSSCVSRAWRDAISESTSLLQRRARFRNSLVTPIHLKENHQAKPSDEARSRASRGLIQVNAKPFTTLQVSQHGAETAGLENQPFSKHEQFRQAASTLKSDESLRKCPRCHCPAKTHQVQERGHCTNPDCGFSFCVKCQSSFHGSRDCAMTFAPVAAKKSRTDAKVGSKKSKRNLRRL